MGYYIDFEKISIETYKNLLFTKYLIPSQRVLLEGIEENFEKLNENDIISMNDLLVSLKTKKKAMDFAEKADMSIDYIIVLRREISGRKPSVRKIVDYPTIDIEVKEKLVACGLNSSKDVYDFFVEKGLRESAAILSISEEAAVHIARLMDVTRLRYVSPIFSTVMVLSGYDTVEKISKADAGAFYNAIRKLNKEKGIYKGNIGLNDIKFLIEDTELVDKDLMFI
jgi:hypothetical protein